MKPLTMRRLRQFHHFIGLFFVPSILLFAISGGLQTFRLQEEKGWGGTPPSWIVWMASVHKDSRSPAPLRVEVEGPGPRAERGEAERADRPAERTEVARAPAKKGSSHLPMKIFVALMSLGLIASSVLGVVIGLNHPSTRRMSLVAIGAGTVLPLFLLLI